MAASTGSVLHMGKYEQIAIELLQAAFGDRFVRDDSRIFSFGPDAGTGEVERHSMVVTVEQGGVVTERRVGFCNRSATKPCE